jgi:hypothetical protein
MRAFLLAAAVAACCPDPPSAATVRIDYPGCNTRSCEKRMRAKAHRKTVQRWRQVARPHRGWLASTRACETRGQPAPYTTNTGNGFYGAYQFTWNSWHAVDGSGYPHHAEPAEQDYRAVLLLQLQGHSAWPVCG